LTPPLQLSTWRKVPPGRPQKIPFRFVLLASSCSVVCSLSRVTEPFKLLFGPDCSMVQVSHVVQNAQESSVQLVCPRIFLSEILPVNGENTIPSHFPTSLSAGFPSNPRSAGESFGMPPFSIPHVNPNCLWCMLCHREFKELRSSDLGGLFFSFPRHFLVGVIRHACPCEVFSSARIFCCSF